MSDQRTEIRPDEFAGHTPEPWLLQGPPARRTIRAGKFGDPREIASIHRDLDPATDEETEANARLIAAAPRLARENRELRAERDALKAELDAFRLGAVQSIRDLENEINARQIVIQERNELAKVASELREALADITQRKRRFVYIPISPAEAAAAERLKGGA